MRQGPAEGFSHRLPSGKNAPFMKLLVPNPRVAQERAVLVVGKDHPGP